MPVRSVRMGMTDQQGESHWPTKGRLKRSSQMGMAIGLIRDGAGIGII